MQELAPDVWTPNGAQLPRDGGVLVGWTYESRGTPHAEWRYSEATTDDTLVPGVTVIRPKQRKGPFKITSKDGATIATFELGKPTVVSLPAPIATTAQLSHAFDRRSRTTIVVADVADPPPADAFGVITYAKGKAIDFARIEKDDGKHVALHRDPGRCRFLPSGLEAPTAGSEVTFAYVDAFGRLGKASKPVKVVEDKPAKDDD